MLEKSISEQRMVKRMTEYWDRIRGEEHYPQLEKFNTASIPDVWDFCFQVKVKSEDDNLEYKYEYVGQQIIKAFGKDLTGQKVNAKIHMVPGGNVINKMDECVQRCEPVIEQGKFINEKDKIIKYRSCILPFGNHHDGITHLIVGMSWKAY